MRKAGLLVLILGLSVGAWAETDILILGTTDRITELSFANSHDYFTWHILRHTTRALLSLEPGTNKIVPGVAKSWEVSEDGLVYTFHIRSGLKFWDGTPCNAKAVKWALERTIRLNDPMGRVELIAPLIKSIEAVDDLTVKITLRHPDRTFLIRMTDHVIPSLIYAKAPEKDFAKGKYVGLGPYKIVEYKPVVADGHFHKDYHFYLVLEAADTYFGKKAKTKKIVWLMYSDAAALRAAIEAGDIDVAYRTLNPNDIMDLKKNPDLQVIAGPSASIRYLLFNVTKPPVDNVLVRLAIAYAVDRDAICRQIFSGLNKPIYTMVPKVIPPAGASIDVFPKRDLAKAGELLKKAGYSVHNPLKVNVWYTPEHYGTTEADVATVIKSSLEETWMIQVHIQSLKWDAYVKRMSQGAFDMFLSGWYPDYLEVSNFLAPWTTEFPEGLGTFFNHHPNYSAYKDIMEAALVIVDEAKRAKLYQAIQILSAYDVPWIPLYLNLHQAYVVAKKDVKGLVLDLTMELHLDLLYKE